MGDRLVVQEQDGRVTVAYQRAGQLIPEPAGPPFEFICPLTAAQREDLRWYLEEYLTAPFAVYEERGQTIQGHLNVWGEALFNAIFGREQPAHDAYVRASEHGGAELILSSNSAGFLTLPWELLKDPDLSEPLALTLTSFDRTISVAAGAAEQANSDDALRVLMVIARPAGIRDVAYQMIARRLLERLDAVRGKVVLDVLRPPTFDALQAQLEQAREARQPYQVLHFDGHGSFGDGASVSAGTHQYGASAAQGYVVFEEETGGQQLVSAADFASAVNRAEVPLVVLNACRSGTLGEVAVEATVATRLLEGGTASVVAMGYSVYAVAAAEFMEAFYRRLFAGDSVSAAVMAGRRQMYNHKGRPSPKGLLPLDDWTVPVHYLRRSLSFPRLKQTRTAGKPSLDEIQSPAEDSLEAVGRFVGRDDAFYELERALRLQRVVVIHGPGGMGKTELAKAFARWWRDSGGVDDPNSILFHAFEPGLALFGLDGMVGAIGLKLFGPEFIIQAKDPAQRQAMVLQALQKYRMLMVWDNFESVYSMPDPTGATPPLGEEERKAVAGFLADLVQHGRSGVIITSRSPEPWLGHVHRQELYGLKPQGAAELAEDVLAPYSWNRERRAERAYAELLAWFDGHPLSLRLMLPKLEHMGAADLLAALRGEAENLPPGFEGDAGEGRLASLGASVKYSFDHLQPELRERLPALGLFEGVVDEDVLAIFSTVDQVPAHFAGVNKEAWTKTLQTLTDVGLLTAAGGGMYALHPALPAYLAAEWRLLAGDAYEAEHTAAQQALLQAYAAFGGWLLTQILGGSAETAVALLERQRRTMGRLVGMALKEGRFAVAQALLQPLDEYWDLRGLGQEANGWVDRCRGATERPDGTPPDFDSAPGALWLFIISSQANRAIRAGDLDAAEEIYQLIRGYLEASSKEASSSSERARRLGVIYQQLGSVALERDELPQAEQWYRKSLEMKEALGDRPGMASNYHQLGSVALERDELPQAEQWYRKSLRDQGSTG
jgi:tetratricopeptide (TPR) repeat protein